MCGERPRSTRSTRARARGKHAPDDEAFGVDRDEALEVLGAGAHAAHRVVARAGGVVVADNVRGAHAERRELERRRVAAAHLEERVQ